MVLTDIRAIPVVSDTDEALTDLQRALLRAGVQILDADHVADYQREKLAQAKEARRKKPIARVHTAVFAGIRIVATLVGAFCGFEIFRSGFYGLPMPMLVLLSLMGAVSGALAVVVLGAAALEIPYPRAGLIKARDLLDLLAWRSYLVGACGGGSGATGPVFHGPGVGYDTVIPEEGRDICRAVGEADAMGTFTVEQLDNDPFLLVKNGDEKYYLFAWDESGYVPR